MASIYALALVLAAPGSVALPDAVATADQSVTTGEAVPREPPAAFIRRYWRALAEARSLADTQRLRAPDMAAYRETESMLHKGAEPACSRLRRLQALVAEYALASVATLVASDGERALEVRLEARHSDTVRRVRVHVVAVEGRWRVAREAWLE